MNNLDPALIDITKYDRFIPSAFVTTLMVVIIPAIYGLIIYQWKYSFIYYFIFAIFIMLSLWIIYLIVEEGIKQCFKEVFYWISTVGFDSTYLNILYLSSIGFVFALYITAIDYATCFITTCVCNHENPYKFMRSVAELIGSGLIPVLGLIFQENRKNDNTRLDEERIITQGKTTRVAASQSDSASNISIFVDAAKEDEALTKQVLDCLESNKQRYLPPITFRDSEINIRNALQTRLKFCEDILVLCGSESFVFWVKNRLRFYSRHKLPTTKIFILCSNRLNAKFDEYKSSQDIAIIELPNGNIDCKEVISKITK